ncbi:MAG: hopanoid biosynthesis-associated protein HpnK [Candidatus Velthaea sp.]
MLTTIVRQPWLATRFRVRQWGRLPFLRGSVLLVSNHQHEDESEIIVQRAFAQGPWHSPLYAVTSRRVFEPGFFGARLRWLAALDRRFDFTRIWSWVGMVPIENHLRSRPLRSLAYAVRALAGDVPLREVFADAALEGLDEAKLLSNLEAARFAALAERTTRIAFLREPYRAHVLAALRAAVDADIERIRALLHTRTTVYVTPEGDYSTDGRMMGRFKGILRRLDGVAPVWLAAVAFDPFRSGRLPMLYRVLLPADSRDVAASLAAARPVTASALLAAWVVARDWAAFTAAEADAGITALLAALPVGTFVDPELRTARRAILEDMLAALTRRGLLVRAGVRFERGAERGDRRFPEVRDQWSYHARFLLETIDAAERLARAGAPIDRARPRLIVTADDFGLAIPVNEAVERAHREGILTTASLMVAEDGAADAVRRARRLPTLRVGLHLVLVAGRPLLPPPAIPDLVDGRGMLRSDLVRTGFRFFFRRGIRRQLEAEIRAQFAAFAATGLAFDHVNAQCHMHLHPTVFGIMLKVARAYGSPPMRIPWEPLAPSWLAARDDFALRFANAVLLAPWLALMKLRLRRARIAHNDRVFGLSDVGRMTPQRVLAFIERLPAGVTEMFFHAATRRWTGIAPELAAYRLEEELQALTSPHVAGALATAGAVRMSFSDLARDAR